MDPKFWNLLGLAMRAGKVISGEEQVLRTIRKQQVCLVLMAADASANTKKKIQDKVAFYKIPLLIVGDRYQLGRAIGKQKRVLVAVTDQGFASELRRYSHQ
ncbi:ribosomal protein L7Ae/L30e/S12e/Gadd45 [Caldalkalibacillus thermarum TA2.A1]|uniref:Ribosomal protein L7Ae/L30e/S12e/Gadd45 n=1 Tax=Caldalkalibacillus thermarum (strain TA2.A1) TaxID=986075 RepID=F5L9U4_CALTT|nr:YlxQ family RNA-binding protein [Caldalkalibacillus thermarum]EGL81943.1 ribosomal protein L7Ae/L30e/S12e/Gadd45 [Caldalkalibacillus thermarum TA2.A1]QZT32983.1 YlxQ family RNA-binding protein [Caldalkalibacillus thermarum TA2.A1]